MQLHSALVLSPIEQYLDYVSAGWCLRIRPPEVIKVGDVQDGDRLIYPNYLIGQQITTNDELSTGTRVTILHNQQGSLATSTRVGARHMVTILSQGQASADSCNARDYCAQAINLGLNCAKTIDSTGGIMFADYYYTGVSWLESSVSPTWDNQFKLFRSRAVLGITLGDR